VSDRYQLQFLIAYAKAVMVYAWNRPTAVHICHVTSTITPLSSVLQGEEEAASPHVHTSRVHLSLITYLLVRYSPHSYDDSTPALLSAELHPLCHDKEEGGC
jgi:hypothetical protein